MSTKPAHRGAVKTEPDKRARQEAEEARDARVNDELVEEIWDHALAAILGSLPSAAIAQIAEEDVHTAIYMLAARLDDAGLTVISRDALPGEPAVEILHTLGRWTNVTNALGLAPLNAICGVSLHDEQPTEIVRCPACVAKLDRRWWRR